MTHQLPAITQLADDIANTLEGRYVPHLDVVIGDAFSMLDFLELREAMAVRYPTLALSPFVSPRE